MASGLSYLTYGNVTLYRVVTHEVAQEVVFDESRTDEIYTKYTVKVSGFLHGHLDWLFQYQAPPVDTLKSGSAAAAHQAVRFQLIPRQAFALVVGANNDYTGGVTLLACNPAPLNMLPPPGSDANINLKQIDLCNGPRCTSFVVTRITGDEVHAVDATFEICMLECDANGYVTSNSYGILSNRWSTQDSLDVNMRTVRTYTGVMVVASANIDAQQLRWVVAPPLQPLFRRDHMEFLCTEDALKIRWTVVDVEIAAAAPFPARKWEIRHTVGMNGANGQKLATGHIDLMLEADSAVNKADLIEIAIWVMTQKLFQKTPAQLARADSSYIVDQIQFTDWIGDVNRISASADVHIINDVSNGLWLAFPQFGKPIDSTMLPPPLDGTGGGVGANAPYNAGTGDKYNRAVSWGGYSGQIPDVQGPAAVVGIFACFLQNPCDDFHQILKPTTVIPSSRTSKQSNDQQVPYTATTTSDVDQVTNPVYSDSMATAAYKFWQIDTTYRRKHRIASMPIANSAGGTNPTTAFCTMSPPQAKLLIRVHAERVGDWPEFPDPEQICSSWTWPVGVLPVVLDYWLKPGTPNFTSSGQSLYRASMVIVLGLSRPLTPTEALNIGNDKWTNIGVVQTSSTLTNSTW